MITLTTPAQLNAVLGSATKTNYDRLDITTIIFDVVNKSISGQCQLISSGNASAAPLNGTYVIPTSGQAILTLTMPNLPFFAQVALNTAQQAVVAGWVQSTQNLIEGGIVSVGVVAGTQSTGL